MTIEENYAFVCVWKRDQHPRRRFAAAGGRIVLIATEPLTIQHHYVAVRIARYSRRTISINSATDVLAASR